MIISGLQGAGGNHSQIMRLSYDTSQISRYNKKAQCLLLHPSLALVPLTSLIRKLQTRINNFPGTRVQEHRFKASRTPFPPRENSPKVLQGHQPLQKHPSKSPPKEPSKNTIPSKSTIPAGAPPPRTPHQEHHTEGNIQTAPPRVPYQGPSNTIQSKCPELPDHPFEMARSLQLHCKAREPTPEHINALGCRQSPPRIENKGQPRMQRCCHDFLHLMVLSLCCSRDRFCDQLGSVVIGSAFQFTVPGVPPRRLFVAFDATYLQPCLSQCIIQGQAALVGGAWHQSQQDHSYYPLDQPFNIHKIDKARALSFCRMLRIIVSSCASQYDSFCVQGLLPRLDFCVWDPSAVEHVTMSAASMPLSLSASTDSANYKGNWDTCLEHACSSGNMPVLSIAKLGQDPHRSSWLRK